MHASLRTMYVICMHSAWQASVIEADDELRAIEESRNREMAAWRRDLAICVFLTLPLLIVKFFIPSSMDEMLVNETFASDMSQIPVRSSPSSSLINVEPKVWVMWLLATPVQFFVGKRFYKKAYYGLKAGCSMGMDFLVVRDTTLFSMLIEWIPTQFSYL